MSYNFFANHAANVKLVASQLNIATMFISPASELFAVRDWRPAANPGAGFLFYRFKRMPKMRRNYVGRRLRDEKFEQGELWCSRCGKFCPINEFDEFENKPEKNYGYYPHCRQCYRDWYLENRDSIHSKNNNRNIALKARFVELAGGECQRCGYDTFVAALEFHHVYPEDKQHSPSLVITSGDFEKTWLELDKCCLLCANCHAAYEAGSWQGDFVKREGLLGWSVNGSC